MKLWYQSMPRQTEWGGYPRVLRRILDKVRDPATEVALHTGADIYRTAPVIVSAAKQ